MKTLIIEKLARVIKNKKRLEDSLDIKITNRGKEVTIDGSAENEYIASQVLDALNFGFPYAEAMLIAEEENTLFEVVNIKEHTNRADLERVRGRVIGKGGKALKVLSDLTGCALELKENKVGVIGEPENIERATEAIIAIVKGAKHGAVYKELEQSTPKPIYDLGLRGKDERTLEEINEELGIND